MVIHVTVIRNLPFKSHGVCTIKYGAICNGRFVQNPPPIFDLYPLPYFFLLVNAYSGFSILIAPENVQPKSSCGLCFVHVSRKTFFRDFYFCTVTKSVVKQKIWYFSYTANDHIKNTQSASPLLLLMPLKKDDPSNTFDEVVYWIP